MEWVIPLAGFALGFGVRYLLLRPYWRAKAAMRGDGPVEGTPFSEAEYAENHAESQDWELQQALRRAGTLAKKGKTAEAVGILKGVRTRVADAQARAVLDQEIRRLGGNPEPDPPAPVKRDVPEDPYAGRF